jgi:CubicO group peptidase (beta-lactamase class C family)
MQKCFFIALSLLLTACSGGNNSSSGTEPELQPDFTEADAWMEGFVATEEAFPGGSYVIVDRDAGVIHKAAFGNLSEDSLVLLASTSKVPSVSLLMALHEDDANVDFSIDQPIASYLPWLGVWDAAITTEHLVSNRSGIPGLANLLTRPDDYAPHLCQYLPTGTLQACAELIYTTPLPALEVTPPNTAFDYGGSQWHLAGAVAEITGGGTLNQLWDQYIGEPCGFEVTKIGNNLSLATLWDGNPESLLGLENPNSEGGMMSSLDDYAKLLSLHLTDGLCGENRVLSAEGLAFMREERTTATEDIWGYGMGWWLVEPDGGGPTSLFLDPGFYGSVAWLDTDRQYAAVVLFEEYSGQFGSVGSGAVVDQLIPIIEATIDAAR